MRRAGTSGPYLRASSGSFGPVVWMMPTALSVKSEALITRAHGLAWQAGEDVLAVLLVLVAARLPGRVGDRGDQGCGAGAEPPGQHRQGCLPPPGAMPAAWSSTASCSRPAHATSGSVTR